VLEEFKSCIVAYATCTQIIRRCFVLLLVFLFLIKILGYTHSVSPAINKAHSC